MQDITEKKPIRLGNIYDERFGAGYSGNVWSVGGVSPTLKTMQGGNSQPLVIVKYGKRKDKSKASN